MFTARGIRRLLGGALLSLLLLSPATAGAATPSAKQDLDTRHDDVAKVPQRTRDARDAFARQSGGAAVDDDPTTGAVRSVSRTDGLLTDPSSVDDATVALDYLRDHLTLFGIDETDLASLSLAARYTSPNGVTHLTWQQTSHGLVSYDGLLTVNVARDGSIVDVTGSLVHDLDPGSTTPALSASDALAAAQHDVGVAASAPAASGPAGIDRHTTFANGDSARLVAFADEDGDRLAWRLTVAGDDPYVYDEVIDAASGKVLARHSLTSFADDASVYDYHPGAAAGGTAHTVDLAPYLSDPAAPTKLDGPYAHAYADVGSPNGFNAGEDIGPSSGTDFVYPQTGVPCTGPGAASMFTLICTWSGTADRAGEPVNRAQTTTQLFYYVNNYHDWLASSPIGFTNASHNFEVGGTGGDDPLHAEADDFSGFDNANMTTPPDGTSPQMQMYLFRNPVVNSGDDASVVYHEYTHGLSNRLVNNGLGGGLDARQSGAMGEGWSDFYAMDYLVAHGFVTDTAADGEVVVGEYPTNDTATGIRTNALDCSVGSTDATHCPGTAGAGPGGYDFGDLGKVIAYDPGASFPLFELHADGEIWAETLWDLRKALGATVTRGLVTEAMRLSPSNPSYLDERDAILLADQVAGGSHHAQIWSVFAARGMGYSAQDTSAESTRGTAAFDLPPGSIATAGTPTVTDPPPLGDGDGSAESGETALLRIPIRNTTGAQLTGVSATLTSTTPGVTVGQPTVVYPNLAVKALDTGDIPFAVTLPASLPCATIVALSLTVHADQGDSAPQPLTLALGTLSGTTYTATDLPQAIPDDSLPGATSTLHIPDAATIDRLRVTVSVTHNFIGDLHARLTAPDGSSIQLFERPGGGDFGAGIAGLDAVVFDDRAPAGIQDLPGWDFAPVSSPAITGPYKPDEPLAKFTGHPQAGDWKLRVTDVESPDAGTLTGFAIQSLQGPPACSTTAPAPPVLATQPATAVTTMSATLNGTLDPTTASTDYAFQWGTTTGYEQVAGAGTAAANSGSAPHAASISGLTASTTYHYRLVARRAGTVVGLTPDATFVTPAPAPVYAGVVAADTPAGYWRFGEPSGTTALDSSGHADNGTYLNGPTLGVPGALAHDANTAVSLDGVNDTIRVPDANTLDVGNTFSVEGWVKRSSTAQTNTLMIKGYQVVVMSAASGNQVWLRKANVSTIAHSDVGVPAGGYHHIVVTKNGSGTGSVKIYIDGASVGVVYVSAAQVIQDNGDALIIGDGASTRADFDEFALYDGVLTPARVAAHYAAGT